MPKRRGKKKSNGKSRPFPREVEWVVGFLKNDQQVSKVICGEHHRSRSRRGTVTGSGSGLQITVTGGNRKRTFHVCTANPASVAAALKKKFPKIFSQRLA